MKETNKTIKNNAWLRSGNALWRPASAPRRGPPSPLEALQNPVLALKARLVWELLVRRLKTNSLSVRRHLPSPLAGPETGDITLKVLVVVMMVMVLIYSQKRSDVQQGVLAQESPVGPVVELPDLAGVQSVAGQEGRVRLDLVVGR